MNKKFKCSKALDDILKRAVASGEFFSESEAIRYAIVLFARERGYLASLKPHSVQSDIKKIERQDEKHKVKEKLRKEADLVKATRLCAEINGNLDTSGRVAMCEYSVYERTSPGEVIVGKKNIPALDITEEDIESQFLGGTVKEIFNDLKPSEKDSFPQGLL